MPIPHASSLPPLPDANPISEAQTARLAAAAKNALKLPPAVINALQTEGWLHAAQNEGYVFFERPGYWLRISKDGAGGLCASILPERNRVPRPELGSAALFLPFPEPMQAPVFCGRGARAKARESAKQLWREHEPCLAALNIGLNAIGVRQFLGAGSGGYVSTKTYRREDLPLTD